MEENFQMSLASVLLLYEGPNREHFGFGSVLQPRPTVHVSSHSHVEVQRVPSFHEGHILVFRDLGSKEDLDGDDHAHVEDLEEKDRQILDHSDDLGHDGEARSGEECLNTSAAADVRVGYVAIGCSCGDVVAVHGIYVGVGKSQDACQTERKRRVKTIY